MSTLEFLQEEKVLEYLLKAYTWVDETIFSYAMIYQLICIFGTGFLGFFFSKKLKVVLDKYKRRFRFLKIMKPLSLYIIWLPLLWVATLIASGLDLPFYAMRTVSSFITAWIFIRLIANFIHNPALAKVLSIAIWSLAALNIVGMLQESIDLADKISFALGKSQVSLLGIVKSLLYLTVILSLASTVLRTFERKISRLPNVAISTQVLFVKLLKLLFFTIAVLVSFKALGVDLAAFAVFGGALGVGIGFGLQKVVSNFVSGIILLLERSLKPGDVIAIKDTYGWVQSLGTRYVSIITRDGIEHLIPNEEFVTTRVENWSYSNNKVRIAIPVGVSYSADLDLVLQLCVEAAGEVTRVLEDPAPLCFISGFGDNSVDLSILFWINDPVAGLYNVKSDVYHKVWKKFHEHNIEIPFPQRDLHIKSSQVALG